MNENIEDQNMKENKKRSESIKELKYFKQTGGLK